MALKLSKTRISTSNLSAVTNVSIKFKEKQEDQEDMEIEVTPDRRGVTNWAATIYNVFVMKFCTSIIDIGTDLVSGCNFLNGNFALMIFALTSPEDPDVNDPNEQLTWGVLSLMSAWIPGIVILGRMAANDDQWCEPRRKMFQKIIQYIFLLLIWPIYSVLM